MCKSSGEIKRAAWLTSLTENTGLAEANFCDKTTAATARNVNHSHTVLHTAVALYKL